MEVVTAVAAVAVINSQWLVLGLLALLIVELWIDELKIDVVQEILWKQAEFMSCKSDS